MDKLSKIKGCLIGLSCGDSAGSEVEFLHSYEAILDATGGKGVTDLPDPALYTDDTQMTICVAEALIESGDDMDKFNDSLAAKFILWLKTQEDLSQRRSPGNTCIKACQALAKGIHWSKSGVEESLGCGSAMRSAPIGLFFGTPEAVTDYAVASSRLTHPAELAMCSAAGTALMTHFALKDIPVGCWANELLKIVSFNAEFSRLINLSVELAAEREDPKEVLVEDVLGEGWTGHSAVASALFCCLNCPDDYKGAVLLAANTVGDSDSIACITGALMGAKLGIRAIPDDWVKQIENSEKLLTLAEALHKTALA